MKRLYFFLPVLMAAFLIVNFANAQTSSSVDGLVTSEGEMFDATLRGSAEIPAVETAAEGSFTVFFDEQAGEMRYLLNTIDLADITAAHLHLGALGVNGEVIVNLNTSPTGGETEGVIRSSDLVGPMAGKTLVELADEMEHGNVYVNVHTSQNPKGEIRGQLRFAGGAEPAVD